MATVTIRPSRQSDRTAIMALAESIADTIHLQKKRERFEKAIGTPEMLVGEVDGKFAGFMYTFFKGPGDYSYAGSDELHISATGVMPEFQKNGVSVRLIKSILGSTSKPITIDITKSNYKAISLLTSMGFTIVSQNDFKVKMSYTA